MSTRSDEVYDGIRCAVCEDRFEGGDNIVFIPGVQGNAHRECWEM